MRQSLNPWILLIFLGLSSPSGYGQEPGQDQSATYLLVTSRALAESFQPLVERRTGQGKPGKLVTIEDIDDPIRGYNGTRPDGNSDLQTKIRNCIRDHYRNHGTRWVALGGDENIIPVRYVLGTNKEDARPAELYYSDTDGGSWDLNANGIYGEAADVTPIELYPDVYLGRISVRDAGQASDYVHKVEVFEDTPADEFPYGMLFVTGGDVLTYFNIYDYRRPLAGSIPNSFTDWYGKKIQPYWQAVPIHEFYANLTSWDQNFWGDYTADAPHFIDRASQGQYQFVFYSGHANEGAWFLQSPFDIYGALQLTNRVPFILQSGGCWAGAFDVYDLGIAEAFLRNPNGGAVVVTAYAGWPAGGHQDLMYEEMFPLDIRNMGEAFTHAKQVTASTYNVEEQSRYVFLGDPAIDRRPDRPGRWLQLYMPDALKFYDVADDITIRWNANGDGFRPGESVRMDYSNDSGTTWQVVPGAEVLPFNARAFTWRNHGLPTGDHYRLRVVSTVDSAVSSASRLDFRVVKVGLLTVRSSPLNSILIAGSQYQYTSFTYSVPVGDPVTLQAPISEGQYSFQGWKDERGRMITTDPVYQFTLNGDTTVVALYRYTGPTTHYYVNDDIAENGIAAGNDDSDGRSPQTPMRHIQSLLDRYPNLGWGDVVHISAGTFTENVVVQANHSGITITGAEVGQTILDGNNQNTCLTLIDVVQAGIQGISFQRGKATKPPYQKGGGLFMLRGGENIIRQNEFVGNYAGYGGGIALSETMGGTLIEDNRIIGNEALVGGGGMHMATKPFGGTTSYSETPVDFVRRNLIIGNQAHYGGGISCYTNDPMIVNCTFYGNQAIHFGGLTCELSRPAIQNSIFWGNLPAEIYGQPSITFCDIQGGYPGLGNLDSDPLFADPGHWDNDLFVPGNYHLQSQVGRWDPAAGAWVKDALTSPCIDAGDPADTGWMNELWPNGRRIDIGAYGGTAEASMSGNAIGLVADLNFDDAVDIADFAILARGWMKDEALLAADLTRDGRVGIEDLAMMAENWMK